MGLIFYVIKEWIERIKISILVYVVSNLIWKLYYLFFEKVFE